MSLLNGLATAQIAPTLEDEMAATQQSLLEELHTISEEGILDHNHRDSNADDASVPEQSSAPASQTLAEHQPAAPAEILEPISCAAAPQNGILPLQQAGIGVETAQACSQQSNGVGTAASDAVLHSDVAPAETAVEVNTAAPELQSAEVEQDRKTDIVALAQATDSTAEQSEGASLPPNHDAVMEIAATTMAISTDILLDHDSLFDGIEADVFGDIELSPPVRRHVSLPQVGEPSQIRSMHAPPSPTRPSQSKASQTAAGRIHGALEDDPFFPEPSEAEAGQTTSCFEASFAGFKTGHGKKVELSEKALEVARKLLHDLEESQDLLPPPRTSQALSQPSQSQQSSSRAPPARAAQLAARTPMQEVPSRQNVPAVESLGIPSTLKSAPGPSQTTGTAAMTSSRQIERPAIATPQQFRSASLVGSQAPGTPMRMPGSSSLARFTTPQPTKKVSLGVLPRVGMSASSSRKRPVPKFVTPFKAGKRPKAEELADASSPVRKLDYGKVGASTSTFTSARQYPATRSTRPVSPVHSDAVSVFRLQSGVPRLCLADVGRPEQFSSMQLIARGVPDEIIVILNDASRAAQYAFEGPDGSLLQQQDALDELVARGCTGAKLPWVQNHWTLILWKLAAMVRLDPSCAHERWSWHELIRQLLYRYEREVHRAQRSCLKRIQEHDSSPSRPMVLLVAKILEEENEVQDRSGQVVVRKETILELSDGWYRIQAQVDSVLAQACQRGQLRVGHKLAVMGATLDAQGEGNEVLAAYHLSTLVLSGNATSLASWDARLGFAPQPFFAGLRSLTPEGGVVSLMDVVITKVFPLAYVDAERTTDRSTAPRGEQEEAEQLEAWKQRREDAMARLELQLESEQRRLYDLVEAIGDLASDAFLPTLPEDPSGRLEATAATLFDQLQSRANPAQAVKELVVQSGHAGTVPWLHSMAKAALVAEDAGAARLDAHLDRLCPPRKVRGFRVVRFRDARLPELPAPPATNAGAAAKKRNAHARTVQLTVWDAAQLGDELQEGRRFWVTNLVPTSKTAWRKPDEAADVFLATRRDTKWRPVR